MFHFFLLLLVVASPPPFPLLVAAHGATTDTLIPGQSIKDDGLPLVSSGKEFALGFFSPGNSTGRRYVGIWFHSIPGNAIVWVANRDAPVNDSSGTFTLHPNGTLIVSDKTQAVLWSSSSAAAPAANSSSNTSSNPGLSAQLLDSGNFVVKSNNASGGSIILVWQMFEATTGNTFIPGMRFLLNTRTKQTRLYSSWAADDDPRRGEFTAGFDPQGRKQVFMWKGPPSSSEPQWRTGQWDGQGFTEVDNLQPLDEYGYRFFDDKEKGEMYFKFVTPNSTYARFVLTAEGKVEQYVSGSDRSWNLVWLQPTPCEVYNRCGNYAVCSAQPQDQQPTCECLRGYVPKDAVEWNRGNWSGGCLRRTPLSCQRSSGGNQTAAAAAGGGEQDWFFQMAGVKLPDRYQWVGDVDDAGCRRLCTANCSCSAYAYNSRIGCEFWNVDLADIRFSSTGTPNDLNLRLAASERDPAKKSTRTTIILVCAILGAVFTISAIFGLLWKLRIRSRTKGQREDDGKSTLPLDMEMIKEENHGDAPDLPLLNFEAVVTATENFNPSNLLGKGGFGHVYKGTLSNGQEIAVKRLSRFSGQGSEEFKTEVILIAKLQHRNLVRLMGCSIKGDEKILVYEYMPNKSLDAFLFDPKKRSLLDWTTRFKIIEGIARGLLYLHHDSRLRVVHRDLKVSNILLDEGMEPKISDFGMARIFGLNQNQANTDRVVGTYGYMSPEYAMDGQFSVKSDVYSFGVLLLEIISGKKNQIVHHSGPTKNLLVHGWQLWSNGSGLEFLDPSIRSGCHDQQVLRCIQVGLLCVQDRPSDRPAMSSVVLMLVSETAACPPPKQPTFTPERRAAETDSSVSRNTGCSSAEMTMTEITGR